MGILLGVYKELAKEAEVAETYAVIQERVETLSKYAAVATELLNAEFPNDFGKDDVVELADKLIQRDGEIADAAAKTAEAKDTLAEYVKVAQELLEQEGKEYYSSTVEKLASALFELDAEANFNKEAAVIVEASFVDEFNKLAGTAFTTAQAIDEAIKEAGVPANMLAGAKKVIDTGVSKAIISGIKNPMGTAAAAGGIGAGILGTGVVAGRMSKNRAAGGDL